jgi:hypothetical protein
VTITGGDDLTCASVRLGRVGGVTVRVSWTALVIAWLVTWSLAEFALPDLAPGSRGRCTERWASSPR